MHAFIQGNSRSFSMPLIQINRPAEENLAIPRDGIRVAQQVNDNIDRVNQSFARATWPAVHGIEYLVPNPFGASSTVYPTAVLSHRAFTDAGVAQPIASISLGAPRLDGYIAVTVQYAPPLGSISVFRNAAYNIPSAVTAMPYDSTAFRIGGNISYAAGIFTCAAAGIINLQHSTAWAAAVGGSFRNAFAAKNGGFATVWAAVETEVLTSAWGFSGSNEIQVSAGDTLALYTNQNSGGVIAANVGSNRIRADLSYVAPDPLTVANVTAVFIAGN